MNILFYTAFEVSPEKGGTEKATSSLAEGLMMHYNHTCYSAFNIPIGRGFKKFRFAESFLLSGEGVGFQKNLAQIIDKCDINLIINQGCFNKTIEIRHSIGKSGRKVLLISMLHYNPGSEEKLFNTHNLLYKIKQGNSRIRNIKNLLTYPVLKHRKHEENVKNYKETYENSDKVVVLSEDYISKYAEYAGILDKSKFCAIPNSLSFDTFFNMDEYDSKKKEVLIVSRLDEIYKRLSLALRIWNNIEKDPLLKEWKLVIVGHGDEYKLYYAKLINKLGLKRVSYEGMHVSKPYYQRASIFMMTSSSEGFGLTLTEAQQNACVPIAFNSFGSLTEIISDGKNGIIVPNNDLRAYLESLKKLMMDVSKRRRMAANAVETCKRFSQENICSKWESLINSLSK